MLFEARDSARHPVERCRESSVGDRHKRTLYTARYGHLVARNGTCRRLTTVACPEKLFLWDVP